MIASTSFCLFYENGMFKEISLKIESWHSTRRSTLTIDGVPTVFNGHGQEAVDKFLSECTRLGAKEPYEWEHGL